MPYLHSLACSSEQGFEKDSIIPIPQSVLKGKLRYIKIFKSLSKNWFKSGSIPFGRQKGAPRGCTKWKTFTRKRKWEQEVTLHKEAASLSLGYVLLGDGGSLSGWSPSADQEIPNRLVKVTFLGESKG